MTSLPHPSRVVEEFERGEMILPRLDHEGHVYLAWCYLRTRPLIDVLARLPPAIQRFAAEQGGAGNYNATLTVAYLLLIHERMQSQPEAGWSRFRQRNPDLFRWPDGVLTELYSRETLFSAAAKRDLVPPDLLADPIRTTDPVR